MNPSRTGVSQSKDKAHANKAKSQPYGVAYLIGRLDRALKLQFRQMLKPLGLTLGQYTALSVFYNNGKLSNAKLADSIMVTPQAANELVKVMDENGWIVRKPDPHHGRIINISLTTEGKKLLKLCNKAAATLEKNILSHLSTVEINALRSQLKATLRMIKDKD